MQTLLCVQMGEGEHVPRWQMPLRRKMVLYARRAALVDALAADSSEDLSR